jgi:GOST, seven transmembrane domain
MGVFVLSTSRGYTSHTGTTFPGTRADENYLSALIGFLTVEMVFIWSYYDYINLHGNNIPSKVLLFIVAIMNAGRGALSFFMILIVCMGYSVVKSFQV